MKIKEIVKNARHIDKTIKIIKAWVLTNRGNNKIKFLTVNDGFSFTNLQIVLKQADGIDLNVVNKARIGSSVEITGKIKYTPGKKQVVELIALNFLILKNTDEDFPIQKQTILKEVLRDIPHLRHKTNLFRSIMRIRSTLAQSIHTYLASKDYLFFSSPIITNNDGEGAGEVFVVDDEYKDYFFGEKATLGVTGQLYAEAYANGFGGVYTFGPTFRAENSNTQRHASEFWMVELEVAFTDLNDIINIADNLLKNIIKKTMHNHQEEFNFLEKYVSNGLKNKLNNYIFSKLTIVDYKDVIIELKKVQEKFENKKIEFGMDLGLEHEKYFVEEFIKGPTAVINYPKNIKAFYMFQNNDGKTVSAFDLLVPGIGELIGGSRRECDYEKLMTRINDMNIPKKDLQWYIDLRRFGQAMSSGFGLGFERLVMFVTGIDNIRDAIAFPRTPGKLLM